MNLISLHDNCVKRRICVIKQFYFAYYLQCSRLAEEAEYVATQGNTVAQDMLWLSSFPRWTDINIKAIAINYPSELHNEELNKMC